MTYTFKMFIVYVFLITYNGNRTYKGGYFMKRVLRNKNFILLFQGAFVSEVGNTLYQMVMTFYFRLNW